MIMQSLPVVTCNECITCAGNEMIGKLLKMQMLEDDDELAYTPAETDEALQREADGRPGWMRILSSDLLEWSKMLPKVRPSCLTSSLNPLSVMSFILLNRALYTDLILQLSL